MRKRREEEPMPSLGSAGPSGGGGGTSNIDMFKLKC